jgi:hypothetical protein
MKDDWKRRWVVLSDNVVSYFDSDKANKPKHVLPLTIASRVRRCDLHRANEMEVFFGTHTLYAAADTDEIIGRWIEKLQAAISSLSPPLTALQLEASEVEANAAAAARAAMEGSWVDDQTARDSYYRSVRAAASKRSERLEKLRAGRRPDLLNTGFATGGKKSAPIDREVSGIWSDALGGQARRATDTNTKSLGLGDPKNSRSVYSWGLSDAGQLGDGRVLPNGSHTPTQLELFKKLVVADISAGCRHAAAVTIEGKLIVWGDNVDGQLSAPPERIKFSFRPLLATAFRNVRVMQVACGVRHTLATTIGGLLWSWGTGSRGQLGIGMATTSTHVPQQIVPTAEGRPLCFRKIAAGRFTSAAITDTAVLYMWGANNFGQLGLGSPSDDTIWEPRKIPAFMGTNVREAALGDVFSAFIVADGQLMVCGALGVTKSEWKKREPSLRWPRFTASLQRRPVVMGVAASGNMLAVAADNSLYTCGYGWLGGETHGTDLTEDPTAVSELDLEGVAGVACGPRHVVARCADGRLFVMGHNSLGSLGVGHCTSVQKPIPGPTIENNRFMKVCNPS